MGYKKWIFISIILISIGVILMNTSAVSSFGVVMIAVGGLFLIIGMKKKTDREKLPNN